MHSPFSRHHSRGELGRLMQQERLSNNSWRHIDGVSALADRHRMDDGTDIYGLSRDGDGHSATDMLMTSAVQNLPVTSASNTFYGSRFYSESTGACHFQSRRSSTRDFWAREEDEDVSDGEVVVSLRQATSRSRHEGAIDSYQDSHFDAEVGYEKRDESRSTLSDKSSLDNFAAQDLAEDVNLPAPPVYPYFNSIRLRTRSWQLQFVHGSTSMMGTEVLPAAWTDNYWPAGDVNSSVVDPNLGHVVHMAQPVQVGNSSSMVPVSENLGIIDFLHHWAYQGRYTHSPRPHTPRLHQVIEQEESVVKEIHHSDLKGNECDFQGLNWQVMETTRTAARRRRHRTYKNYVNCEGSDSLSVSVELHCMKN